jgi:hypothetical protein
VSKRAVRRWQQRVAKFRRIRQLKDSGAWTLRHNFVGALDCWWPELWKPVRDLVMSESGHKHWRKAMMTQPARAKEHHALRMVLLGRDADRMYWPDHKRPFVYYW